jgi:hypothetical protein
MHRLRATLRRQLRAFQVQSEYWRSLPDRALLKLLLAVFFMFSTTGLVGHIHTIASSGKSHWVMALASAGFAGLCAAAFVYAFIRDRRLLLPVLLLQLGGYWAQARGAGSSILRPLDAGEATTLVAAYGAACSLTLLLGYIFFIDFIVREGVKHMSLRTEMTLAERTHRFLVPPLDLRTEGLEVYGESRSSSQVGGDLLDATAFEGGTLLYVADVSGHGVAAGTLMSLSKGAMRARLLAGVPLSELVTDLNRVLLDLSSPNMFVTFAGIRLNGPGEAEVCLAGHLPILHFRKARGDVERLPNQSVPLGLLAEAEYAATPVSCGPGDVFAILTDGLTEVENGAGEELGVDGVERLIAAERDRPLREAHQAVMSAVRAHGPQVDDQTLLLIRPL